MELHFNVSLFSYSRPSLHCWKTMLHLFIVLTYFHECWHMCYLWKMVETTFQCIVVLQLQGDGPKSSCNFNAPRISEWYLFFFFIFSCYIHNYTNMQSRTLFKISGSHGKLCDTNNFRNKSYKIHKLINHTCNLKPRLIWCNILLVKIKIYVAVAVTLYFAICISITGVVILDVSTLYLW